MCLCRQRSDPKTRHGVRAPVASTIGFFFEWSVCLSIPNLHITQIGSGLAVLCVERVSEESDPIYVAMLIHRQPWTGLRACCGAPIIVIIPIYQNGNSVDVRHSIPRSGVKVGSILLSQRRYKDNNITWLSPLDTVKCTV